jgi:hypothetical protein
VACNLYRDPEGKFTAIICGLKQHRCVICRRPATKQCDFPVVRNGKAGTCDVYFCDEHGTNIGPNVDYCRLHSRVGRLQL